LLLMALRKLQYLVSAGIPNAGSAQSVRLNGTKFIWPKALRDAILECN
jgi:hypothetical protein